MTDFPIRLLTTPTDHAGQIRFRVAFPAPTLEAAPVCAPATLVTDDGSTYPLGLLCAPTAVTWRQQRVADLVAHTYAGPGPYTATLTWGTTQAQAQTSRPARTLLQPAATAPAVALFDTVAVADQPLQRLVKLRVEGLAPGHSLRLDGGAGQVHVLTNESGATQAVELPLDYAKPGSYTVTLDLLDAEGFWLATLSETPLEVQAPDQPPASAPELVPPAPSTEAQAGGLRREPLETGPQPWLPYRNIRPTRSVYTYAAAGGGATRRTVNPGYYLSVHAETMVGGAHWLQTAAGDWIAASAVTLFVPSELRGVTLSAVTPPPPLPTDTRQGIVTAASLNVRAAPGVSAGNPPIASLRAGAEVTIYEEQRVAGDIWYRIGENRWVHGGYVRIVSTPTPPPPTPPPPTPPPASTRRGVVTAAALNVRARPGVSASNPPVATLRAGAEVIIYEEQRVAGELWYRIGDARWVISTWVRLLEGVTRALNPTVATAPPAQLPIGWVVTDSHNVRARPGISADNPTIGEVRHNQALALLEERTVSGAIWYRIGDGRWVESAGIGVARLKPRPASIGAGERWVGVSLAAQTLVAYEGDQPVYAALIASGLPGTPTVQGIFRTWRRLETGKMSGPGHYLEDVTWTCYFYSGYALHTAYWHDSFGTRRSHGCVNLSPHDAWWVYQWSAAGGPNSPVVYVYWV